MGSAEGDNGDGRVFLLLNQSFPRATMCSSVSYFYEGKRQKQLCVYVDVFIRVCICSVSIHMYECVKAYVHKYVSICMCMHILLCAI